MKKTYTKKQIQEAIKYWERRLDETGGAQREWQAAVERGLADLKADGGDFAGFGALAKKAAAEGAESGIDGAVEFMESPESAGAFDRVRDRVLWPLGYAVELLPEYDDEDPKTHGNFGDGLHMYVWHESYRWIASALLGNAREFNYAYGAYGDPDGTYDDGEMTKLNPRWKENLPLAKKYLGQLYGVLRRKATVSTYSIDFTEWRREKLHAEVEAGGEEEAREIFAKQHPDEYDRKGAEITSIKER